MLKPQNDIVAFIPAAGLGTRLEPLTNEKPKALVQFLDKTMLENVIERLYAMGLRKFIVNIHHFPGQMRECIAKLQEEYDIRISDETDKLLDTGGGLVQAAKLLQNNENTLLVHNVDVFSDLDLNEMFQFHKKQKADISLAVSDRDSSRKLLFNDEVLCGWKNLKTGEEILAQKLVNPKMLSFSGIHIIDKHIFAQSPQAAVFSVMPWYVQLCGTQRICGWEHAPESWADLGTIERLQTTEEKVRKDKKL